MKCVVCRNGLKETFSLGNLYVSNFIPKDARSEDYPRSELTMLTCANCGLGRLKDEVSPNSLYENYWYYSGVNQTMKDALKDVVDKSLQSIPSREGDVWLDIASNDSSLLKQVPSTFKRIGVDPSNVARESKIDGIDLINDYFKASDYRRLYGKQNAKFITCIAMFYDLADPHPFLDDINEILADDGLFVIQISYTPLMFKQMEFGNICSEHLHYYNLFNLRSLLIDHNFTVQDVELNDINGGSFRVYVTKQKTNHFRNQQQRDVASFRMRGLLNLENDGSPIKDFKSFGNQINELKAEVTKFLVNVKNEGKKVLAQGASTKANTLLQYFGITTDLVAKIGERNSKKFGLKTVGTEIPIVDENEIYAENPDYILILPWHFIDEFKKRGQRYLQNGGKFIVPCPKFEVIGC